MNIGLGAYLTELRQARAMAAAEAARSADISRSSLHNWESGKHALRIEELEALLRALSASETEVKTALSLLERPRAQRRLAEIEPETALLPHGGSLLRAMRLRRGWTQEQAAAVYAVQQSTVARWEHAESWPSAEKLHGICFALRAHGLEVAALTRGPFSLGGQWGCGQEPKLLEEMEQALQDIHDRLNDSRCYPLGDLLYLSLEVHFTPLARRSKAGRRLLSQLLIKHALYLGERCQPAEAGATAMRALTLLSEAGEKSLSQRLTIEMLWAVWKFPIEEHASILSHWLHQKLEPASLNWVRAQISASLMEQGLHEEGLALLRKTLGEVGADTHLSQHYRNAYAEALLIVGRAPEAVEMIQVVDTQAPSVRLRTKLALAEGHLAVGNRSQAHDWLQSGYSDNTMLSISYYMPQMEALTARL